MEMLVVSVVVVGAFAAVLIPLFRRRPGIGDEREFENVPPAESDSASGDGSAGQLHGATQGVTSQGVTSPNATSAAAGGVGDIEAEVRRYRRALRAGTLCRRCGQANPDGSRFCYECGARLPFADAKEFE